MDRTDEGGGPRARLAVGPWLVHDAALHALFLGFVMSMVMGHAPIVLPAVLRIALPASSLLWVPLGVLHTSLAVRVGADLAGSTWLRGWAVHGNVTALLLFVGTAVLVAARARHVSPVLSSPVLPRSAT